MLYGLESVLVSEQSEEFYELLCLLVPALPESKYNFNAVEISMALSALVNLRCERKEVRKFLESLSLVIQSSNDTFDARAVISSLNVLINMNSNYLEVRLLLKSFYLKLSHVLICFLLKGSEIFWMA